MQSFPGNNRLPKILLAISKNQAFQRRREREISIFSKLQRAEGEKIQTPSSNLTPDYEQLDHNPINSSTLLYDSVHTRT